MTALRHSRYSSIVCGLALPISLSIGIRQTFNQSLVRLVGCLIAKQVSTVLVTNPLADGKSPGSFGSKLVSELASNDVVDGSCKLSTAVREVSRIDS